MRFASLGSGSEGNALVVAVSDTHLLFDCGFSLSDTERRLHRLGLTAHDLTAIFVTHEHADHARGVARLARRYDLPVYATFGTVAAMGPSWDGVELRHIEDGAAVEVGPMVVEPFTVPHDAREPVQFVVGDASARLGMLTDVGESTPHILFALQGCSALLLEANHCSQMLAAGPYPASLKARVGGPQGHLSNDQAAAVLNLVRSDKLATVVAAHLSQQNNRPELARRAFAGILGDDFPIAIAEQGEGTGWLSAA